MKPKRPTFSKDCQIIEGAVSTPKYDTTRKSGRLLQEQWEGVQKKREKHRTDVSKGNSYATENMLRDRYDKVMKHGTQLEKMKIQAEMRKY